MAGKIIMTIPRSEVQPDRTSTPQSIPVWSRSEFLDYLGRVYKPGQHVTEIGPTQRGKTHVALEVLEVVAKPELPCLILAAKPPGRDELMEGAAERLQLVKTTTWPPPVTTKSKHWLRRKMTNQPPNGWLLMPDHVPHNPVATRANLQAQFTKALRWAYARKIPIIVLADEIYLLYKLGLKDEHEDILTRGAPVVSIISVLQRGRNASLFTYDQPEHILFFMDPDMVNVRRYAEMVGGVDPSLVRDAMKELHTKETANGMTNSEFLYFRRSGSQLVIVEMDG